MKSHTKFLTLNCRNSDRYLLLDYDFFCSINLAYVFSKKESEMESVAHCFLIFFTKGNRIIGSYTTYVRHEQIMALGHLARVKKSPYQTCPWTTLYIEKDAFAELCRIFFYPSGLRLREKLSFHFVGRIMKHPVLHLTRRKVGEINVAIFCIQYLTRT